MAFCFSYHLGKRKYKCEIHSGFTLFCLTFLLLCIVLGVWQLHRYDYKKTLLATYQARLAAPIQPFVSIKHQLLPFQHIQVTGQYLTHQTILWQNKVFAGQNGFEVLTPLQIPNEDKLLLVNRGWVKEPSKLLKDPAGLQTITGYIKYHDEYQFILGANILEPLKQPLTIQRLDIAEISAVTKQSYFPFILRLDSNKSSGYLRDWPIVTLLPERHMAYAVQWFLLAFVLLVAFFCFSCRRV